MVEILWNITWKQEPLEQVLTFLWGQKKDPFNEEKPSSIQRVQINIHK